MKKDFSFFFVFTIFSCVIGVSLSPAQDNEFSHQTRLIVMFKPEVVSLPQGTTQANPADIPNLPNWLSGLAVSTGLQSIAKTDPGFVPGDTLAITEDGRIFKKLDFSNIYTFVFPEGRNLDSIVSILSLRTEVIFAERWPRGSFFLIPNDEHFGKQWSLLNTGQTVGGQADADIDADEAWNYSTGTSGRKVGIIDSGVRGSHEDLSGKVLGEAVANTPHGTHVAGIAAAKTNNFENNKWVGIAGVDWNAKIYSKDVSGFDPVDIKNSIIDAVNNGSDGLNNSWGVTYNTIIRSAFKYAYMNNKVAVAAMGNDGGPAVNYPAAFGQGIIAVGATDDADKKAGYSTTGNHIDVAAPGGFGTKDARDIYSTWGTADDAYIFESGTSMAAPHVTPLVTLLRTYNPNLYNDDIENIIKLSAEDKNSDFLPGWDTELGWGRINAKRSFDSLQIPNTLEYFSASGAFRNGPIAEGLMSFYETPGLDASGPYLVKVYEALRDVTYGPTYYVSPHVWGRGLASTGYSPEIPNWAMPYCEVVPGTVTPIGCRLRSYVYDVYLVSGQRIGWRPSEPEAVSFGYTVLGERQLSVPPAFGAYPIIGPPNRINTSWRDCNVNEQGFRLKRKAQGEASFTVIADLPPFNQRCDYDYTAYSDQNIIGSESLTYKVEAYTRNQSVPSPEKTVTSFPREPQNLTATVLTDPTCGGQLGMESFGTIETEAVPGPNCNRNLVDLSWQPPSAQKTGTIAEYTIHARSTDPMHYEKWLTVPGTVTEATICLKVDKTYDFWVYTKDIYGAQSIASNKVTKTTGHSGAIACVDDPPVTGAPIPDADPNDKTQGIPKEFSLSQNYPNPFNLSTQIKYSLPQDAEVQLVIYNILGQKIKEFDLGNQTAGYKSISWDGKNEKGDDVPSGVYLYRIKAGSFIQANKMTLLK